MPVHDLLVRDPVLAPALAVLGQVEEDGHGPVDGVSEAVRTVSGRSSYERVPWHGPAGSVLTSALDLL